MEKISNEAGKKFYKDIMDLQMLPA